MTRAPAVGHRMNESSTSSDGVVTRSDGDGVGAGYYVVVVILVYGMSIVMLIASHIKRKNTKLIEDRQIDKYLEEFQTVREMSSRDRYRSLRRAVDLKLSAHTDTSMPAPGPPPTPSVPRCLSYSLLPLTAVGLPRNSAAPPASGENSFRSRGLYVIAERRRMRRAGCSERVSRRRDDVLRADVELCPRCQNSHGGPSQHAAVPPVPVDRHLHTVREWKGSTSQRGGCRVSNIVRVHPDLSAAVSVEQGSDASTSSGDELHDGELTDVDDVDQSIHITSL